MNSSQATFLTIITRDYYWWAKTWADSVTTHHPNARIIVAIADNAQPGHLDSLADHEVLSVPEIAADLGIENYARMAFQYTPFELTCSLKPFLIRYLQLTDSKVIYMDADTLVYRPLQGVISELDDAEVVATPHLSHALDADSELRIRSAGTLNGGFLGTRTGAESKHFLNWWADRCAFECYVDPFAGKFVDQSWLDLAMHYYDSFRVLRDETLNVAYWNLPSRKLTRSGTEFQVNNQPLGFFHFSGFDPDQSEQISRFATWKLDDGQVELTAAYRTELLANQRTELQGIGSEYLSYLDGTSIDPLHREAIRGRYQECLDIVDPFDNESNTDVVSRLESIREQAILARKHWQLDELQRLADLQTEWIQKHSQRKFNRRMAHAVRRFCSFVKDRLWSSGQPDPAIGCSPNKRKVA